MADWPTRGDTGRLSTEGEVTASSRGTVITASATAHTKGAWTQIVASTPFDAVAVLVQIQHPGALISPCLLDLGVGAAASEIVVAADLQCHSGGDRTDYSYLLRLSIPEATRIAARCQSAVASQTLHVTVTLLGQGFLPSAGLGRLETWGAVTTGSTGTVVDAGATANTKGAWVQLIASTGFDTEDLLLAFDHDETGFPAATRTFLLDIGLGAAAAEQVVIDNLAVALSASDNAFLPRTLGPVPCRIPAGTRVAARCQCSIATAGQREINLIAYGVG